MYLFSNLISLSEHKIILPDLWQVPVISTFSAALCSSNFTRKNEIQLPRD